MMPDLQYDQRFQRKQAALLKQLIDADERPELGRDWHEFHLRLIGYAQVLFSPNRSAYDQEPNTAVKYTGPRPIYDEERRLVQPGQLLYDWE